jgi:hypothetical protein
MVYIMPKILTRYVISAFCGIFLASLAISKPPATDGSPSIFPYTSPGALQVMPIFSYEGGAANGRVLSQVEGGVDVGVTKRLSVGATLLVGNGHGKSSAQNTYHSDGNHLWGDYNFLSIGSRGPVLGLLLDHMHNNITLHIPAALDAWPHYNSTGAQLTAQLQRGQVNWLARTGIYGVDLGGYYLATDELLGGGVSTKLSRRTTVDAQLTGYEDYYSGGKHASLELTAGVSYAPNSRSAISLSGSLFPRGVPVASTPFSSAAAVGLDYAESFANSVGSNAIGYLTLSAHVTF